MVAGAMRSDAGDARMEEECGTGQLNLLDAE